MKKTVFCLMAIMFCAAASAQRLIPVRSYGTDWGSVRLLNTNKPNGYIYRLRDDVRNSDLKRVEGTENLEMIISEPIDLGWIALYRTPMVSSDYSFVAVTYDSEGTPLRTFDLCDITGISETMAQHNGSEQLFNMKGQAVQGPLAPGIYIKNGRKFIKK